MRHFSNRINVLFAHCVIGALTFGACDHDAVPVHTDDLEATNDENVITPEGLGFGDGWIAVDAGLWTHTDGAGDHKYLGIGEAGKIHAIASLLAVEEDLEVRLTETPSEEMREKLAEVQFLVADLNSSEDASIADDDVTLRCSFNVSAYVDAYPIACGAAATASATFSHPCGSTKGTVKTFAQAWCNHVIKTHQCGPYSNDPASCNSAASITGAGPCTSYAYAQVYGVPGVNVYIWDNNAQRGACGGPSTSSGSGGGDGSCTHDDDQSDCYQD